MYRKQNAAMMRAPATARPTTFGMKLVDESEEFDFVIVVVGFFLL